ASGGASGYTPDRAIRSAKLIPPARTSIRTRPGSTAGSGSSLTASTSGPPWRLITTPRMEATYRLTREVNCKSGTAQSPNLQFSPGPTARLEVHGLAAVKVVAAGDLLDDLGRDRRVGRQRRDRLGCIVFGSIRRRHDVRPVLAEGRADEA